VRRPDGVRTYLHPTTNALVTVIDGCIRSEIPLVDLYVWTEHAKPRVEIAAVEDFIAATDESPRSPATLPWEVIVIRAYPVPVAGKAMEFTFTRNHG
jgi:hypothetical protein